jgi:enoyl-CoA hydratase/carnithine racemase
MTDSLVLYSVADHIAHIQLNRADKLNAANRELLAGLAQAFTNAEADAAVRVVVVSAIGDHFTAGLDLGDVLGTVSTQGIDLIPEGLIDPWGIKTAPISKPVVVAAQGTCLTLGMELILASDIAVADTTAVFSQLEVSRGILPFGGATTRLPARVGWGNAMRYLLTGDKFDAAEALRIGFIQEITVPGKQVDRALELAGHIAAQAPLAVAATLRNARLASRGGEGQALASLPSELDALLKTSDFAEGIASFTRRECPNFTGQ